MKKRLLEADIFRYDPRRENDKLSEVSCRRFTKIHTGMLLSYTCNAILLFKCLDSKRPVQNTYIDKDCQLYPRHTYTRTSQCTEYTFHLLDMENVCTDLETENNVNLNIIKTYHDIS